MRLYTKRLTACGDCPDCCYLDQETLTHYCWSLPSHPEVDMEKMYPDCPHKYLPDDTKLLPYGVERILDAGEAIQKGDMRILSSPLYSSVEELDEESMCCPGDTAPNYVIYTRRLT